MANEHYTQIAILKPIISSVCRRKKQRNTGQPASQPYLLLYIHSFVHPKSFLLFHLAAIGQMRLCNMLKDINIKRKKEKIFRKQAATNIDIRTTLCLNTYTPIDLHTAFQRSHICSSRRTCGAPSLTLCTTPYHLDVMR